MREVIKLFKAVSDPNRLRILKMLEVRTLCVCEIADILGLAPSTVSKHLSILYDARLINSNKDGKWVNYELNVAESGSKAAQLLSLIRSWLNDDAQVQQDQAKAKVVDRYKICAI